MNIDDILRNGILLRTLEGAIGWIKKDNYQYIGNFNNIRIDLIDNRGS